MKVKNLYDIADESSKKNADNFIMRLKSGKIKRRILKNTSNEFNEKKAFDAFKNIVKSKSFNKAIKKSYK